MCAAHPHRPRTRHCSLVVYIGSNVVTHASERVQIFGRENGGADSTEQRTRVAMHARPRNAPSIT
jgi:hypothetical protein